MDFDRQKRLLDLSLELLDLDEDSRCRKLETIKREDPRFFEELAPLIREEDATVVQNLVDKATSQLHLESPVDMELAAIENYDPIKVIGEGGMGRVYLAQQTKPIKRQVALKVIRSRHFGADALSRFEFEGKTLAMMNHPAIAVVYDGGLPQKRALYRHGICRGSADRRLL